MSKASADGMPQSEASGKSTETAECAARAARRLSCRRLVTAQLREAGREIFWRNALLAQLDRAAPS